MTLEEYYDKRDFKKTPEPHGSQITTTQTIFVVQRHEASHLHYDFRLAMDGVLKSWAVPKGPPTTTGIRRLAVAVEDHPLEYAQFEGVIPAGHYGAGKVEIWDHGVYELQDKGDREIKIRLHGSKLAGNYLLLHMRDKNWLLFKTK